MEVFNEIVDEEMELLESKAKPMPEASLNVADDEESDVEMVDDFNEEEAMTHVEAMDALRELTLSCKKLGVPEEATVHLDCFKRALIKAQASKKKKSTIIHDFFSKKAKTN